jgi:hypothetical protein
MKELILQLEAKLAELKALQAADPNINIAFTEAELQQLIAVEKFAKPRIEAVKAHEAKQKEKQAVVSTTTEKPAEKEAEKEETLDSFLTGEKKPTEEKLSINTPDVKKIATVLNNSPEAKEIFGDDIERLKNAPRIELNIGENGGDLKLSKGDNSIEGGFELDEDGSLKSGKFAIETESLNGGLEISKTGGSGNIGAKTKDSEGNEIAVDIKVGVDLEKKEVSLEGKYSKEKEDGSKVELKGELKVSKEELKVKAGKMETDAYGHKQGVEGELQIDMKKGEGKASFGIGTADEKKETKTEISGSLEVTKNKAVAEITGKHSFPILKKKKVEIPFASVGLLTFKFTAGIEAKAEVELKAGMKLDLNKDKGDSFMAKVVAKANASVTGSIGLAVTIVELVQGDIELAVTAAVQATAEIGFQVGQAKDRFLGALHDVKGAITSEIVLTLGAATWIKETYESFGGSASTLESVYKMGQMELVNFQAPSYYKDKGWDTSSWGFSKGKDILILEEKAKAVGAFFQGIVDAIKAIAEFIGNVLSAIGNFIAAIGKKLIAGVIAAGEAIAAFFSDSARKEQEARAQNDAKFKQIVETAIKAVKKNPKHVDRIMKVDVAYRKAELEKIVLEDELVKKAWRSIYETQDMKAADDNLKQLKADIKEFRLVCTTPKAELGSDVKFDFILNSTSSFPVDGMRIDIKCNGKRIVMFPINGLVEANLTKRNYSIKLPSTTADSLKGVDLAKAKWTACAVLDLAGDLKDQASLEIPFVAVAPRKPVAKAVDVKSTSTNKVTPTGSIAMLGSNLFILSWTDSTAVKARLKVDISPDSVFSDRELSWASIALDIRCGSTLISSVKLDQALRRGIVNVIDVGNLFLPKRATFFEIAKSSLSVMDLMFKNDAEINSILRKTPITLNLTVFGFTLMTEKINVVIV